MLKNDEKTHGIPGETVNPNLVDHLRHPLALTIRSLLIREERKELKQIIIDDEENIIQAIQAKIKLYNIFTTDKDKISAELYQQLPSDVPIVELSKRTGKKIFGNEKVSRIFAIAAMPEAPSLDALSAIKNDLIVLDKLCISGNIGAIIRTSVALNAGAMILLDSEPVDTYDRRVIRASRGYIFKLPILNMSEADFIQFCHRDQIKILVTTSHTELSIDEAICNEEKLAIVFGSEKEGTSKELFNIADIKARIPIFNDVESLNVSAAASIILYLRSLQT